MEIKLDWGIRRLTIQGTYTPEERPSLIEADGFSPGALAEFEIESIQVDEISEDLSDLFSDADIKEFERLCIAKLEEKNNES